jgi:hypothetical protein
MYLLTSRLLSVLVVCFFPRRENKRKGKKKKKKTETQKAKVLMVELDPWCGGFNVPPGFMGPFMTFMTFIIFDLT